MFAVILVFQDEKVVPVHPNLLYPPDALHEVFVDEPEAERTDDTIRVLFHERTDEPDNGGDVQLVQVILEAVDDGVGGFKFLENILHGDFGFSATKSPGLAWVRI